MAECGPPKKRQRGNEEIGNVATESSLMWKVEAVLSNELTDRVKLEPVLVSEVTDKKAISRLVRELTSKFPAERLKHVKRVKSTDSGASDGSGIKHSLWICPLSFVGISPEELDRFNFVEFLKSHEVDSAALGEASVCQVPTLAPLTRSQYDEGAKHWPITFHESQEVKKKLNTAEFTEKDLEGIGKHMETAVSLARVGQTKGALPIGAVVVDPSTQQVMASAYDLRHQHPLHHVTMVIIDLVARGQGGGVWNIAGQLRGQDLAFEDVSSEVVSHGSKSGPYLCRGYDLFITREPCIMCSMALLHARIDRVFYGCPSTEGALGTTLKLHTQKGLNHHFDVFRGIMEEECKTLFQNQDSALHKMKEKD